MPGALTLTPITAADPVSYASAAYRLVSNGVNVVAYDTDGDIASSGTDAGQVLDDVLELLPANGGMVQFRNDGHAFPWGSVPGLPGGVEGRIVLQGNGSVIALSTAGPRFLDFKRTATTSVGSHILPVGTFNVTSTEGFPTSGAIQIGTLSTSSPTTLVTYTGKTATSFTGCSTATVTTVAAGAKVEWAHETFQNITIEDFVVDADSIGSRQHVILGTYGRYADAGHEYRMNIDQLAIRRVKAINVLTDSNVGTNHRLGLYLVVGQAAAAEATQSTITNVEIEDVRIEGGNYGFTVGGTGIVTTGLNVFVDNIRFRRCWHSLMALQAMTFPSVNYFVGVRGFGGKATFEDCYGQYSADVGFEIDALDDVTLERCAADEAFTANFFHTNFTTPKYPATQTIRFKKCVSRRFTAGSGRGFYFNTASISGGTVALGTQIIEGCTVVDQYSGTPTSAGYGIYRADAATPAGTFNTRLVVKDTKLVLDGWDNSAGGTFNIYPIQFNPSAGASNAFDIDGLTISLSGVVSGSPTLNVRCVDILGTKAALNFNNIAVDAVNLTGMSASSLRGITLGRTTTTLQGWCVLRGFRWDGTPADTTPFGIVLQGTSTLTSGANAGIRIENCDFSPQTSGSGVSIVSSQNAKVFRRNNGYGVGAPVIHPSTLTGLVTATGKQLSTTWDSIVTFTQGTGTAITAIDYSTDAGQNYINFLTQSSGALPAGFDMSLGPLPTDALIKVTFTGTQPTINLVPTNP